MPRARVALLTALVALVALPAGAGAVLPGVNGRIVFASGRSGTDTEAALYMRTIVGGVGGGEVFPAVGPVTGEQHRHPSWSPDRTKIVYARGTPGSPATENFDIYILNVETGATSAITNTADGITSDRPAWSPDGARIAFENEVGSNTGQRDIVVYDIGTGNATDITNTPSTLEGKPAWSPDSQTIYLEHGDQSANTQTIASMPAGGGAITDLPGTIDQSGLNELQPSISPDGTRVCYTRQAGADTGSADVLVSSVTSPSDTVVLANDAAADYNCTFSPDGRFVAYVNGASSAGALVMERADNSSLGPIPLEDTTGKFDGNPDWAPDGPPQCNDSKAQAIQGRTVKIRLRCHDTGPAYERTDIVEAVANDSSPAHGKLGAVKQGDPSTVPYTANAKYIGPDQFEFVGLGINGGSDRGLASILVLEKGACANMQTGNERANRLSGTIAGDRLLGLNGRDVLRGFAGRDCLFGGGGNDRLNGGGNADRLQGDSGSDTLKGGDGGDSLNGGTGKDRFDGGKGNDRISAADGRREVVRCGAGRNDRAVVDHEDTLHGCEHVTRK